MANKKRRREAGDPFYSQVSTSLWDDAKFLSLDDDGRALWLFFLTSSSTPIPGVVIGGVAAIAERMNAERPLNHAQAWTVERVRNAFAELISKQFAVRWEGRVVWLMNATKHRRIAGPNQIVAMGKLWGDVPRVSFKRDLWTVLREAAKSWSKDFDKHIPEPFREPVGKPFPEPFQEPLPLGVPHYNDNHNDKEKERESSAREARDSDSSLSLLPSGWVPDRRPELEAAERIAIDKGLDVTIELQKFRAYAGTRNQTASDWTLAFVKWLLDARPASQAEREVNAKRRTQLRLVEERKAPQPALRTLTGDELAELERMSHAIAHNAELAASALRAAENDKRGEGERRVVLDSNPRLPAKEVTG